ncbi:MAG: DUF1289 domain-containing protein [Hyphomicrobiaceae bacterium]
MSVAPATAPVANRHSPCIGVCRLETATGWCEGCGRTGVEIAGWVDADDARRLDIFSDLPERLTRLGAETRVLPWTGAEIVDLIARRVSSERSRWSIGKPSKARLLAFDAEAGTVVDRSPTGLVAHNAGQSLALTRHDKLRGFADVPGDRIIGLGLPTGRAAIPPVAVVTDLGPDARTLGDAHHLYDLGLGGPTLRLAIRPGDAVAAAILAGLVGQPEDLAVATLADRSGDAPFVAVAETVLTRLETHTTGRDLPGLLAGPLAPGSRVAMPDGLVPAWAAPMLFGHPIAD